MDELEISGKRYISTRRAGKEHGYHSDYIGQLIRGNKVGGQKVGRAWYVDAESLTQYLGKDYAKASRITNVPVEVSQSSDVPREISPAPEEIKKTEEIKEVNEKVSQPTKPETTLAPEEHRIPIHKPLHVGADEVVSTPQPMSLEARGISVMPVISLKDDEGQARPKGNLTYITDDDEPILPEIHRVVSVSRQPAATHVVQGRSAFTPTPNTSRNRRVVRTAVLAGVGGLIIAASTLLSTYISSTVRVVGQTASIFYSTGL